MSGTRQHCANMRAADDLCACLHSSALYGSPAAPSKKQAGNQARRGDASCSDALTYTGCARIMTGQTTLSQCFCDKIPRHEVLCESTSRR